MLRLTDDNRVVHVDKTPPICEKVISRRAALEHLDKCWEAIDAAGMTRQLQEALRALDLFLRTH